MSRVPAHSGAICARSKLGAKRRRYQRSAAEQKEVARRGDVDLKRKLRCRSERMRTEQELTKRLDRIELRVGQHRVATLAEICERDERQVPAANPEQTGATDTRAASNPTSTQARPVKPVVAAFALQQREFDEFGVGDTNGPSVADCRNSGSSDRR